MFWIGITFVATNAGRVDAGMSMASQEWQWGAILLALATALPHVAVHQEKRHLWVEEARYVDV